MPGRTGEKRARHRVRNGSERPGVWGLQVTARALACTIHCMRDGEVLSGGVA